LISKTIDTSKLKMFSSNYTLYGDMSDRVMKTLSDFVPRQEVYSIDESFLDMSGMENTDLLQLGARIKATVQQNCGIPVCVGIAPIAGMLRRRVRTSCWAAVIGDIVSAVSGQCVWCFTTV